MRRKIPVVLAVSVLLSAILVFAENGKQEPKRFVSGANQLGYLLYLPEGYGRETEQWPLILYLHGSGERGTNLELLKNNEMPKFLDEKKGFPFIVVSPQCPAGQWWDTALLGKLVAEIRKTYSVDTNRMYLTGLSMGGYAAWQMVFENPAPWAAVAPVCGGLDDKTVLSNAARLKNLPVWAFHGGKDRTVPTEESVIIVDKLRSVGSSARLTIYPELGHNSWSAAYNDPALYVWMLGKRKGGASSGKMSREADAFFREWMFLSRFSDIRPSGADPVRLTGAQIEYHIERTNPLDEEVEQYFTWVLPAKCRWKVEPAVSKVVYPSKSDRKTVFKLTPPDGRNNIFPLPRLAVRTIRAGKTVLSGTNEILIDVDGYFRDTAPFASAVRFKDPPVVDGNPGDEAWKNATPLGWFAPVQAEEGLTQPVRARLGYDNRNLYVLFECSESVPGSLKNNGDRRDANLWEDDSVELFLDPGRGGDRYLQFIVNSAGLLYDARVYDRSWNSTASVATGKDQSGWYAEIAVPWNDLGYSVNPDGTDIGIELCRNRKADKPESSQWCPTFGGNHMPERFGRLELK